MPSPVGLPLERVSAVAKSRGLSQEQVRKQLFIRYRDFTEIAYFGSQDVPAVLISFADSNSSVVETPLTGIVVPVFNSSFELAS